MLLQEQPAFPGALMYLRAGTRALGTHDNSPQHHSGSHGPFRRMLKLIVEIDSSRFLLNRLTAALALAALLAAFAGIGYGIPAVLSRYF